MVTQSACRGESSTSAHSAYDRTLANEGRRVGVSLVGEGLGFHIPKGYIYFAMAFSVLVELLNLRVRGRRARMAGK